MQRSLKKTQKKTRILRYGFLKMVHSGGFEPPTARFVAEYSIQLSYECRLAFLYQSPLVSVPLAYNARTSDMVHSGGFEPPTARFVAEYSIQLSYECMQPLL